MRVTIDFDCKDPAVERHYQRCFYSEFHRELCELGRRWEERLRAHAALQEHYDYVLGDDNQRRPVFVRKGDGLDPVPLVPNVGAGLEL